VSPRRSPLRALVGLFALAAGALGCAAPSASYPPVLGPGPRALVHESRKDFGTVEPGTQVRERFEITNVGDHPLDILSLSSGCRCTAMVVTDRTIWPGRTGAIEVSFDTTGLSGRHVKAVRLATNDPSVAEIELAVYGEVAADLRVEPERVYLGRIGRGEVAAGVVNVVVLNPEVAITDVASASGQIDVTPAPLDEPARGLRLVVVPRTNGDPGRFSDSVVVSTTSQRQPRIVIPVLASVENRPWRHSRSSGAVPAEAPEPEKRTARSARAFVR
jgi:Protein of unknown function (DUF1573)